MIFKKFQSIRSMQVHTNTTSTIKEVIKLAMNLQKLQSIKIQTNTTNASRVIIVCSGNLDGSISICSFNTGML